MPGLLEKILQGNFSSPLTLVFVLFTLLAFYFLFRLGMLFFVKGEEVTESVEGKKQVQNLVRLLAVSLFIAFFTGFIFEFLRAGSNVAQSNAPGAAQGFFGWLLGK
jgi:hypothetical protein